MIIRVDRTSDTAEQNQTEKTPYSFSRTTAPNGSKSQARLPTTGSKLGEEDLIKRPLARNPIEIRTSVQFVGSMMRESSWTASF